MPHRLQRTICEPATVTGIGFLTGRDISLRFQPAPADHGIVFRRIDCPGAAEIPALIALAPPRERRTALERDGVAIEMVEHVLAAAAGLGIDNCLIEVDGPEIPGCDGSARAFTEALAEAGIEQQAAPRPVLVIDCELRLYGKDEATEIAISPLPKRHEETEQACGNWPCWIDYRLDYGPDSPIGAQQLALPITPETFRAELAAARTFVLESEVAALRAQGYGRRTTARDLLVFGPQGVIDNRLRFPDECVRHKILDCVGDFALLGCDIAGQVRATRSGHRLNRALVRRLHEMRIAQGCKAA